MQAIAPLTPEQLRAPVQTILYKLEVWDGAVWRNLAALGGRNYIKSISVSLGGAGLAPEPIAGSWSATLHNDESIFHPEHPTSVWADLLRVGREVRISVGGHYAGVDYYWQRLIGFMDAPRFDHTGRTVSLSGLDYGYLLTNKYLGYQRTLEESGSDSSLGPFVNINGPTHWGSRIDLDSEESEKVLGAELYAEADALEIGVGEANNVTNWTSVDGGESSVADAGAGSTWAAQFDKDGDASNHVLTSKHYNEDVAALVAGTEYFVSFWYKRQFSVAGRGSMRLDICETGTENVYGGISGLDSDAWVQAGFSFIAPATGAARMMATLRGPGASGLSFRVDEVSIKAVSSTVNKRYVMPDECNGPYFVTYNGDPVWQGFDEGSGWHYDESSSLFWLDDALDIADGSANLRVYYYTDQIPENVVADLLVHAGLYASRAAALADMNYTPTGITLGRVWFDSSNVIMTAVAKLCERCDYRFWLAYSGQPCFQPSPDIAAPVFIFTEPGHVRAVSEFQDRTLLRNHVTIEGIQLSMYPVSREDKTSDRLKAEVRDDIYIGLYLEHSHSIQNHLFQDQASADTMAALILERFKDPRWAGQVDLFANPVPLEVGDTIRWETELAPSDDALSESGRIVVTMWGIIRDIKMNDNKAIYKVERGPEPSESPSASVSASASGSPSASASASAPESPSVSASESVLPSASESGSMVEETLGGEEYEEGDWAVPTGVSYLEIEGIGPGGAGGARTLTVLGGGGGGGAAWAKKALAVTPGELLHYYVGQRGAGSPPSSVWQNYGESDETEVFKAAKGTDGMDDTGGAGGQAVDCIGDTARPGGDGGSTTSTDGNGAGSSAGPAANGNSAANDDRSGAGAPAGGGEGGDGGVPDANGEAGGYPGGGGGGSGAVVGGSPAGGDGAAGYILFRYWA